MGEIIYQSFFKTDKPYGWGSNFYKLERGLRVDGERWNDSEAYFQAMKFRGPRASVRSLEYSKLILKSDSPMKSKALGTQKKMTRFFAKLLLNKKSDRRLVNDLIDEYGDVKIRGDWEGVKIEVMTNALIYKFMQYPRLRAELKSIPDNMILVEHSNRDRVWGDGGDGGTGEKGTNYLGKILTALAWVLKYGSCEEMPSGLKKKLKIQT